MVAGDYRKNSLSASSRAGSLCRDWPTRKASLWAYWGEGGGGREAGREGGRVRCREQVQMEGRKGAHATDSHTGHRHEW